VFELPAAPAHRTKRPEISWKRTVAAAVLLAAITLSACRTAPQSPRLPPQQIETGSTFTLLSPLTFPAGQSQVLFQEGRIVGANAISPRPPYCKLVPHAGAPLSLSPGTLRVGNVSYDERESTGSAMFSITRISLSADPNKPGYTMSCGWSDATTAAEFVSTEQIYSAIRGQFTMQLLR